MGRTLDHYICPKCGDNWQNVGSIDPEPVCNKCGTKYDVYGCDGWAYHDDEGCSCPINKGTEVQDD